MEDLLTRPAPGPSGISSSAVSALRTTGAARAAALPNRTHAPGVAERERGGRLERLVAWRHFDALLVVALMALALVLHARTLWTSYWGDEAIAVGIGLSSSELPAALPGGRRLPAPLLRDAPLLDKEFGPSEVATHALSLVPGLLAVPAAWWSGGRLFGGWAARAAAGLVATCAYLAYYSTETRMYSWLVLVALLAVTCFVLAYRGAGRRYWAATTLLMAAVLYLQYYGLYLVAATVIVGSAVAVRRRAWSQLRATCLYGAACAALFAPWAPQFLYQLTNTGAPWAPHPSVLDFFGDSFNALASAAWAAVVVALVIAVLSRHRAQPAGTLEGPAAHVRPRPGRLRVGVVHRHTAGHPPARLAGGTGRQLLGPPLPRYRRCPGVGPLGRGAGAAGDGHGSPG